MAIENNTSVELANDNSQESQSLHLPQEIIEGILSRVSVKADLLKFRCVSKSWRCLIDNEQFIKSHLENSSKKPCYWVILHYNVLQQCNLQSLLNGASFVPVNSPTLDSAYVVGTFNGLVCLVERDRYFIMWNPCTGISKRLPEIDSGECDKLIRHCGMGWFESSGEYKIFAVIMGECVSGDGNEYVCKVYSSKTNSWNTVRHEGSNLRFEETVGKFLNGKLHWVMDREPNNIVVSFDLKSEVFGMSKLPHKPGLMCSWSLGVLGGKLCALFDQSFWRKEVFWRRYIDVWVMKEYGVKDSWRKLEPPFPASVENEKEKGEVVVFLGNVFMVYCSKENVFHYMDGIPPGEVVLCMETLVSPSF